jgi:uncharacterized membrane protein
MSGVSRVLYVLVAALCLLLGAILAVFALIVLVTKLTSLPDVRALLFIAGFGLASFGCFWTANRLRRASLSKVEA